MPAHRKPTALLEANGAFRKNPSRRRERENEPVPEGPLGEPPKDWLEGAAAGSSQCQAWIDIWNGISEMVPFGVLSSMDRIFVESTCYLWYRCRRMIRGYLKWNTADFNQLNRQLAQIGCIPSERSRVQGQAKTAEVASEWAELAAEQQKQLKIQ